MIAKDIVKKFTGVAGLNMCSAALNLATTVLIVRWCGSSAYADFMVDLAVVSLLLLVLEAVPSNLSVFRLQDDRGWRKVVEWHLISAAAILIVAVFLLEQQGFQAFTPWIALYATTQVLKRFLDLMLQSSGRLKEFMGVEAVSSLFRLMFLSAGVLVGLQGSPLIWGSLALSVALTQLFWLLSRRKTLSTGVTDAAWTRQESFIETFRTFIPYYPGIALKRIKDNLLPLVGNWVLGSKEALGMLMLAYRGLVFANGQLRIFEALLYHRGTLKAIDGLSTKSKTVIAGGAQAVALAASLFLLLLTDEPVKPFGASVLLSFLIWPMSFYAIERANAFSGFQAGRVNVGLMTYVTSVFFGAAILWATSQSSLYALIAIFLSAEILQYLVVRKMRDGVT